MLRREPLLRDFDKVQMQRAQSDYFQNLRLFEALYREAKQLGALPLKDPLEGIDVDIRLAKVVNVRTVAEKDRPGLG